MVNSISISRPATLRATLASIALGCVLVPLNSTMIAVALPDMLREFHIAMSTAGWLVTAYLMTMAILQLIAGKLGDRFGRRKLMLGGLVYFGLASLCAALSPGFALLLFFRVQQAIAGAMIVTNGVALAFQLAPADQRGSSLGLVNAAVVLAAAVGPLLGGVLVGLVGWPAIFWVNIPLVIAALILGWSSIPGDSPLAVRAQDSKTSFSFHVLQCRTFVAANIAIALSNLALYVTLLAIPILLSYRVAWSSLLTGMILAAMSVAMAIFSPLGGRWADRVGRRLPAVTGLALLTVALMPLAWWEAEISVPILLMSLACAGVGQGLSASALQTSALEAVEAQQIGVASGIASTSRYLGSIIGSCLLTGLLDATRISDFNTIFLITVLTAGGAAAISLAIQGSPICAVEPASSLAGLKRREPG